MKKNIFVLNSYMWLHSFYSRNLPRNGETLIGTCYRPSGGGKGANQAFAAAYEGCNVELIGRIGDDAPGYTCRDESQSCGIGTKYLQFDKEHATGCGCILRDEFGGNAIVIVPGVNDYFLPADFDLAADYIRDCTIGGFQLEVNVNTVAYAIRETYKMGVKTFLDPAPAVPLPEDLYPSISFIKPNEHEATILTGIEVTCRTSAKKAGEWFLEKGVNEGAIITLGEDGCVVVTKEGARHYPCPHVEVVDPTCAGDSFAGSFMAAIAEGRSIDEAVIRATGLAALTVSRAGSMFNCFFDCDEQLVEIRKACAELKSEVI